MLLGVSVLYWALLCINGEIHQKILEKFPPGQQQQQQQQQQLIKV